MTVPSARTSAAAEVVIIRANTNLPVASTTIKTPSRNQGTPLLPLNVVNELTTSGFCAKTAYSDLV